MFKRNLNPNMAEICERLVDIALLFNPKIEGLPQTTPPDREETLKNIAKYREITKEYIDKLCGLKLPACYVGALVKYLGVLSFYQMESDMGLCRDCPVKIGALLKVEHPKAPEQIEIPIKGETAEQAAQRVTNNVLQDAALGAAAQQAAEEEKKINLYDPDPYGYKKHEEERKQEKATAEMLNSAKTLAENRFSTSDSCQNIFGLASFEALWQEYEKFLKETQPYISALTPESISEGFINYLKNMENKQTKEDAEAAILADEERRAKEEFR